MYLLCWKREFHYICKAKFVLYALALSFEVIACLGAIDRTQDWKKACLMILESKSCSVKEYQDRLFKVKLARDNVTKRLLSIQNTQVNVLFVCYHWSVWAGDLYVLAYIDIFDMYRKFSQHWKHVRPASGSFVTEKMMFVRTSALGTNTYIAGILCVCYFLYLVNKP